MADVTGDYYSVADVARIGYGTEWLIGDSASPETFQAVKGVVSFQPGSLTTGTVDVTHLRSEGRHREMIAGIRESGPFQGTLIWIPEDESQSYAGGGTGSFTGGGLAKLAETGEQRNMKLRFDNGTSPALEWPFRGFITEFTPSAIVVDDKLTMTVSVQPAKSYSAGLP